MTIRTEPRGAEAAAVPSERRRPRRRVAAGMVGGLVLLSAAAAAPSFAAESSDDAPAAAPELVIVSPAISAVDSTAAFGGNLGIGLGSAVLFSQLAGLPIPGLDAASADLAAATAQLQAQALAALHTTLEAAGDAVAPLGSGLNPILGPVGAATLDSLSEATESAVALDQLASNLYPTFNAGAYFAPYLSTLFDGLADFMHLPEEPVNEAP